MMATIHWFSSDDYAMCTRHIGPRVGRCATRSMLDVRAYDAGAGTSGHGHRSFPEGPVAAGYGAAHHARGRLRRGDRLRAQEQAVRLPHSCVGQPPSGAVHGASLLLGREAHAEGNSNYDPSRIASTVVQGVGFVAAGVIFASRGRIQGLTTAASIWVTAAIGLLAGAGFFWEALLGTIAVVVVLELFERLEARFVPSKRDGKATSDVGHD